ncbi:phage integrase N-terminal SAM-like domain-containing protein [Candidatus Chloroploca sp. M-50]|uniref:Phage integrase N-terminal SAM-like domain-containing protein n=1 Tax=Candidatus Chloroploca mongolica TaxID=2528176 RepID=A0ABS4D4B4_9CHLR|nr:phage integrase N-terminal SAM-like domain-containing protein [Candidatus Chloroploca mongolica]
MSGQGCCKVPVGLDNKDYADLPEWLPRKQAEPEIVEAAGDFDDQIANDPTPEADGVLEHATAFDAAVDLFNPDASLREIRRKHYSLRTEEAYVGWVRRFVRFHQLCHPREMGASEVSAFLTHLAVEGLTQRRKGWLHLPTQLAEDLTQRRKGAKAQRLASSPHTALRLCVYRPVDRACRLGYNNFRLVWVIGSYIKKREIWLT